MSHPSTSRTLFTLALGIAALGSLAATPANSRTARERQTFDAPQAPLTETAKAAPQQQEKSDRAADAAPQKTAYQPARGHQV